MKAASTQYEIDIQMSPETLEQLMQGGFALYALKAVQTTVMGGAPLVWYQTGQLLTTTSIVWQEQYQAYVSASQIVANGVVQAAATADVDLGQTASVTASGIMEASSGGAPDAISILNQGTTPWTCGLAQMVEGQVNPVCAIPLHGNMLDVVTPVEQVLLMFSTNQFNTGTVMFKSYAPGLLVDLTAAPQRAVQFDINNGWSWDGSPWASQIPANSNLVPLLIQS